MPMKNPIIKHGAVTRIGELIDADNKTYGEETRERNARQRKWKSPTPPPVWERRHQTVAVGPESALCLFLFLVAASAFCKLLALLV